MTTDTPNTSPRLARALPYILIISGILGFICAFIIMIDKLQLLTNPSFRPNCDLDPIISCGSVMASKQGSAFGFPNPLIGLAAFPVLITAGMAMLAGGKFKHWFWRGLNAGLFLALLFVHWLFFESVYRLQALCPYCMVVWVVTITSFLYVTLYNAREGHLPLSGRLIGVTDFARRYHLEILISWLLVITALILHHFWYYYGTRLHL
jgi:uncharacterized membrane protein